jgi:hypothetical protein
MQASIATVTITGFSPYSQSRQHDDPRLDGEGPNDYDIRTWRSKMTVETRHGHRTVVIPARGIHQCIADAAKYSKRQIPGQGKATWTAKFTSGIMLIENPSLDTDPETVICNAVSVNADGVRGSGKRVMRRFPTIPAGWSSTFEVYILDPIITEQIFREMVELAGLFIGIGQFRPQNMGSNGRFRLEKLLWADNRKLAA